MSYRVKVKYLIPKGGLLGKSEYIEMTQKTIDLEEFYRQLEQNHAGIDVVDMKENYLILVNGKVHKPEQVIRSGDEVAIVNVLIGG